MNFPLLKTLCETPGIANREDPIRERVRAEMAPLVDEISVDAMGNIIGRKKGRGGPTVMLAAHLDEIGFIVKAIDDRGFVRVHPVGGWDPRVMMAQRVHVHGFSGEVLLGALTAASKPIHLLTPEEQNKPLKVEDFYVDLGMPAERVKQVIEIGDMVTMARTAELIGDCVLSKTLDNRVGVFVMLEALRACGDHAVEILAVATTQEEVGLRGATTAAYALQPDVGIALDVTLASDLPGHPEHEQISRLGDGCAIKIMDSSLLCHPKLVRHFRDLAERHQIKHQLEIMTRGGTDAGGIQRSRGGVPSFTLSVPTRYVHTVNEMAHTSDIEAAVTLLARYLEDAHSRDYRYN